jgi:hypothetical protein
VELLSPSQPASQNPAALFRIAAPRRVPAVTQKQYPFLKCEIDPKPFSTVINRFLKLNRIIFIKKLRKPTGFHGFVIHAHPANGPEQQAPRTPQLPPFDRIRAARASAWLVGACPPKPNGPQVLHCRRHFFSRVPFGRPPKGWSIPSCHGRTKQPAAPQPTAPAPFRQRRPTCGSPYFEPLRWQRGKKRSTRPCRPPVFAFRLLRPSKQNSTVGLCYQVRRTIQSSLILSVKRDAGRNTSS